MRVAFVKFGGLSAGGTERWLQEMAVQLARDHEVTFFYSDTAPYTGSEFRHPGTNQERKGFMEAHNVRLIEFSVGEKDITSPLHIWRRTDFWNLFDETEFDVIQTAVAGPAEYPYFLFDTPVVEFVALDAGCNEFPDNVIHSIHPSQWQRGRWVDRGGDPESSSVIPVPAGLPSIESDLREDLGIPGSAVVAGFHQRDQDEIFSPIPLEAFGKVQRNDWYFVLMGGSDAYRSQAEGLALENVRFVDHSADPVDVSRFLNTLDVFAHGRSDGETFGTVFAEALMHGRPCLSHESPVANAQRQTMGPHGVFVAGKDEYASALDALMADDGNRRELSAGAREFALANYSLDACGDKLRDLYSELEIEVRAGFQPRGRTPTRLSIKPRAIAAELKRMRVRRMVARERRRFPKNLKTGQ